MRKILLILSLWLAPTVAFAQCTGVFPPNTVCGNSGASPAPPTAMSGSTVVGPGSTTINDVVGWANTVGSQLKDMGASTGAIGGLNFNGSSTGAITIAPQANAGTWNFNLPTTPGTAGQVLTSQGGGSTAMTWGTSNNYAGSIMQASGGNPTGTASTTAVMMGIGSVCTITPGRSTRVFATIYGNMGNNTANDGGAAQGHFGTGTAPINGAAAAGVIFTGNGFITNNANTANMTATVTVAGMLTGLTPGTTYWIDVSLQALTGGTATFQNVTCVGFEM